MTIRADHPSVRLIRPPFHISRAVIAISDASCDPSVVDVTLNLARHYTAEVYMVRVDPPAGVDPGQKLAWLFSEDEGLNRLAAEGPKEMAVHPVEEGVAGDIRWVRIEAPSAAPAILHFAHEQRSDLLVLETHRSHNFGRAVFGGTPTEISRWATCPVLSIPQTWAQKRGSRSFDHIMAPIDFSEQSLEGLTTALELASRYHARVSVVFVLDEPVVPRIGGRSIRREVKRSRPEAIATAEKAVKAFCKDAASDSDVPIDFIARSGAAASKILDSTDAKDADLIVISSHGLSGDKRYSLGSVCDRVLRRAECPVLVLKTPDTDGRP